MPTWTGWPPRSTLSFYTRSGPVSAHQGPGLKNLDLSDELMLRWPHGQRTIEMRLSTQSTRWHFWDEDALALIEDNIRYDLGDDGYRVIIKRLSGMDQECSIDMCWKLIIRAR